MGLKTFFSGTGITDMHNLDIPPETTELHLSANGITGIKGIDHLKNLQIFKLHNDGLLHIDGLDELSQLVTLELSHNKIGYISGLSNLTQLRQLILDNNEITEIRGLEGLHQLTELVLHHNAISRITGLDNLSQLKKLNIGYNKISAIEGLDHLENLEELSLIVNPIKKISGLEKLTKLKRLSLFGTQISEIANLENLRQLEGLYIYMTPITEIKGLDELKNLRSFMILETNIGEIKGLENNTLLEELLAYKCGLTEIKGLDTNIKLKRLDLKNNFITEIKGLDNNTCLEELNLEYNKIGEIKGLENLVNLKELNLGSKKVALINTKVGMESYGVAGSTQHYERRGDDNNYISEIKGLDSNVNLITLVLAGNRIKEIKGLEKLTSLSSLNLQGNQIAEIKNIENLESLAVLDLNGNRLDGVCLERLLRYKTQGYMPNLRHVNLSNNGINWRNPYIVELRHKLYKLGLEIESDNIKFNPFEDLDNTRRANLIDYLYKELGLQDEFIEGIISWFDKKGQMEYLMNVNVPSFNKPFRVKTKDGRKQILKIHSSRLKAEIEQAANYHLSRGGFYFVAPTDQEKPFEYSGVYITIQDEVVGKSPCMADLPYHLTTLAMLHAHGKDIMENAGIILLKQYTPGFMELFENIRYAGKYKVLSVPRILQRKGEFEEVRDMINRAEQTLVHGDPKFDNRLGHYWLDMEGISVGDKTTDLAMVLNDPKMIIPNGMKKAYLSIYQYFFAREKGIEYSESDVDKLLEEVKQRTLVRIMKTLSWIIVHPQIEEERIKKIEFFAPIVQGSK